MVTYFDHDGTKVEDVNVERYIEIATETEEEKLRIGNKIHDQLRGNSDYVNSEIVLNIDEPLKVRLWFFEGCKEIPEIKI